MDAGMIVIIAAAMLGAVLGLAIRNGLLAVLLALIFSGAAQYGLIFLAQSLATQVEHAALAEALQAAVGAGPAAILPTLAASGLSAGLAAALVAFRRRGEGGQAVDAEARLRGGRQVKGVRARTAVEQRAIHDRAESRLDQILRK